MQNYPGLVAAANKLAASAQFEQAQEKIQAAQALCPDSDWAKRFAQSTAQLAKDFPAAVADGKTQLAQAAFSKARASFTRARQLCPNVTELARLQASLKTTARKFPLIEAQAFQFQGQGQYEQAKNSYNAALKLCPAASSMLKLKGDVEREHAAFNAELAANKFQLLKIDSTLSLLLEDHVPPTVFVGRVVSMNFHTQRIHVDFVKPMALSKSFSVPELRRQIDAQTAVSVKQPAVTAPTAVSARPPPTTPVSQFLHRILFVDAMNARQAKHILAGVFSSLTCVLTKGAMFCGARDARHVRGSCKRNWAHHRRHGAAPGFAGSGALAVRSCSGTDIAFFPLFLNQCSSFRN